MLPRLIRGERSLRDDQTPVNVGVLPADEDMSVEEHKAILVGDDIIKVGGPADVVPPVVGRNVAAATVIRGESNPRSDRTPVSVGVSPAGEGTEVEFMIDTGCQVTILTTLVFEQYVCRGPVVWIPAATCRQWLVSADSSQGKLDKTIVFFPGLQCDMVLVVASIGLEGMLGTEALQSCLPHQPDLRMGQLWADGQSTLQLHQ